MTAVLPQTRERHYRQRLHTGRHGYRGAGPVRQRVNELRAVGWTWSQISEAANVSAWVPIKIANGTTSRVLEETERKLLALHVTPRASHRGVVNAAGTYRRIEALQWLGWPMRDLGQRIGLAPYTLSTLRSRGEPVSHRVALKVREVYEQLSHLEGPSRQTATKARRSGYAPPMAWDDELIDDPAAEPQGTDVDHAPRLGLPLGDDLLWLAEVESVTEIARRYGVRESSVKTAIARAREKAA